MGTRQYWSYILVSGSGNAMYIGVTNDLERRIWEHRNGQGSEFARKYQATRLVYSEEYDNPTDAIAHESSSKAGGVNARTGWCGRSIRNFGI